MLSIFKKLFGKPEPKAVAATPQAVPAPASTPIPTIEVAHLSLPAIIGRFPEELKLLLTGMPAADATVALPIPTILKQLPTGAVKMSLASLHRQAHGLIKPLPPGDKRSVDIPLAEVFRHVRMELLRRRPDQRHMDVPEIGFNLFGDVANPYAVAPDDQMAQVDASSIPDVLDLSADSPDAPVAAPTPMPLPRVLKMDDGLKAHFGNGHGNGHGTEQDASAAAPAEVKPRVVTPPTDWAAPATPAPSAAAAAATPPPAAAPGAAPAESAAGPRFTLLLTAVSAGWPAEIRTEIAGLDPATTVSFPAEELSSGLARGRVSFNWGQIRSWLNPPCSEPSAVAAEMLLQLPLKVVAPAFLASSKKPTGERKKSAPDESIPALFNDARPPAAEPEKPAAAPAVEPAAPAAEPAAEPVAESVAESVAPAAEPVAEPAAAAPAPEQEAAPEHVDVEQQEQPAQAAAPTTAHQHEAPPVEKLPETVGEIFNQPQKQHWTPAEIVSGTVTLTGVAGAIVALQEGLVVSASLPEGVKSDVIAAFLPQIFARLNQYSGEMRLGDVDDLLFTTHGAHCQIYRLGYIYFAVLGKTGESLPWHELRLLTEELARQTQQK